MGQDFSNKISIVINKELPMWQAMNALAHISANFGNYLEGKFDTGESFITLDNSNIPRNTQYPIVIFETDKAKVNEFAQLSKGFGDVKVMYFIKEMIETSNDVQIAREVARKNFDNVEFLGVGLFGNNEIVKQYTKQFKLWS